MQYVIIMLIIFIAAPFSGYLLGKNKRRLKQKYMNIPHADLVLKKRKIKKYKLTSIGLLLFGPGLFLLFFLYDLPVQVQDIMVFLMIFIAAFSACCFYLFKNIESIIDEILTS